MKMENTNTTLENTAREMAERFVRELDWKAIHKEMVNNQYGMKIEIYEDGTYSVLTSGSYTKEAVAVVKTTGEYLDEEYFDGWLTRNDDGELVEDETGKVWDESAAVRDAIENGEWYYEEWSEYQEMIDEIEEYYANGGRILI